MRPPISPIRAVSSSDAVVHACKTSGTSANYFMVFGGAGVLGFLMVWLLKTDTPHREEYLAVKAILDSDGDLEHATRYSTAAVLHVVSAEISGLYLGAVSTYVKTALISLGLCVVWTIFCIGRCWCNAIAL